MRSDAILSGWGATLVQEGYDNAANARWVQETRSLGIQFEEFPPC